MTVVREILTSLPLVTQCTTVTAYNNHLPEQLVRLCKLSPKAVFTYVDTGLIGVRHEERILDKSSGTKCVAEPL